MSDFARYLPDTCQILSDGVRYMFEISVQILSGDVGFCQVPFRHLYYTCQIPARLCQVMSDTCLRYLSDSVRWCQILSGDVTYLFEISVQILSGAVRFCHIPVRYMSDYVTLCQVMSDTCLRYLSCSVRWCQILSGGVRYPGASSSKGSSSSSSSSNSFGPAQGPCTRALVKGPAQGPLARVLPKGPGEGHALIYVTALSSAAPAKICVHLQPSSSRAPSSTSCEPR